MSGRKSIFAVSVTGLAAVAAWPAHVRAEEDRGAASNAFIVPHQDDWQLFMGDVAVAKVATGRPVVFIYLTTGGADLPPAYWQARENGGAASAYAAVKLHGKGADVAEDHPSNCQDVSVLSHRVHRCAYENTVSYYLRLPDGNYAGEGFPATRSQSLAKLNKSEIKSIDAVDGSTAYQGWGDLVRTVENLLGTEAGKAGGKRWETFSLDPDTEANPGDHSDHHVSGLLAAEVATALQAPLTQYAGYDIANRPANLSVRAAADKISVFMSYERQLVLANPRWSSYVESPAAYSARFYRTYGHPAGAAAPGGAR